MPIEFKNVDTTTCWVPSCFCPLDNSQLENTINEIRKRSGAVTVFNKDKISNAMYNALAVR